MIRGSIYLVAAGNKTEAMYGTLLDDGVCDTSS